ncbi:hypothetical protein HDE_12930 [Halotydeus destructor]|nr:hypothetical protein HDE_12930 [Halotydeus destructor]
MNISAVVDQHQTVFALHQSPARHSYGTKDFFISNLKRVINFQISDEKMRQLILNSKLKQCGLLEDLTVENDYIAESQERSDDSSISRTGIGSKDDFQQGDGVTEAKQMKLTEVVVTELPMETVDISSRSRRGIANFSVPATSELAKLSFERALVLVMEIIDSCSTDGKTYFDDSMNSEIAAIITMVDKWFLAATPTRDIGKAVLRQIIPFILYATLKAYLSTTTDRSKFSLRSWQQNVQRYSTVVDKFEEAAVRIHAKVSDCWLQSPTKPEDLEIKSSDSNTLFLISIIHFYLNRTRGRPFIDSEELANIFNDKEMAEHVSIPFRTVRYELFFRARGPTENSAIMQYPNVAQAIILSNYAEMQYKTTGTIGTDTQPALLDFPREFSSRFKFDDNYSRLYKVLVPLIAINLKSGPPSCEDEAVKMTIDNAEGTLNLEVTQALKLVLLGKPSISDLLPALYSEEAIGDNEQ